MSNIADIVDNMEFVEICSNEYEMEPTIEFALDGGDDGVMYEYDDFIAIIGLCNRMGIDCRHLEEHVEDFEKELKIFANMKEPDNIPPGM